MNDKRIGFGLRSAVLGGAAALGVWCAQAMGSPGFTASDSLGSGDAGKSLKDRTVYVVPQDATIERPSTSANSALYVQDGATAVIYIPSGVTLTVRGGNAQGQEGAGAGIRLNEGAQLVVTGGGTLNVAGGHAADGGKGGESPRRRWTDCTSIHPIVRAAGRDCPPYPVATQVMKPR